MKRLLFFLLAGAVSLLPAAATDTISLGNDHIKRNFARIDGTWRTTAISRADGTDPLTVESDEFHILFFNDRSVTVRDYQTKGEPISTARDGRRELVIRYVPRENRPHPPEAPDEITVTHSIGNDLFMRKTVELTVSEAFSKQIDRIEVERFSTPVPATRGGRGQPVFLADRWFVGIEHPSARTRHTDGNTPTDNFEYDDKMWGARLAWLSNHNAQGRDVDKHPRNGLVRCMHFPAYPTLRGDGKLHLTSKSAVIGTAAPGDTLELGFMDYFRSIRRQPKRLSHYNNWYDSSGKDLSIANFSDKVLATYNRCFSPYGVRVDSMVPDNFNWHTAKSLYQPNPRHFPGGDADLRKLNEALTANGSRLGLWLTLSGNNGINPQWAKENGYQWGPGGHFLLANPKNKAAMKKRLKELITGVGVNYFKHDFNTLQSTAENGHAPDARHGHEAETDALLELLRWEYECDPEIFVNFTSGTWFSPWLLAECNSIWMLSHDDGAGESGPEPSNFLHQQSYRDEVLQVPWENPATRPLIPVSQLMTHGIICGPHSVSRRYNNIAEDSLDGWADGVMLYYMRGTLLQEWYITPQDLSQRQWDALGRASRWSMENEATLVSSVFWGGDPAAGEPYGYAAWNGTRGIISMRNSLPVPRKVSIPFDQTVWYRGRNGVTYRAEVAFPWHNEWPVSFTSGKPIEITVPPFTVMVMHLEPGTARGNTPALVEPIPVAPKLEMANGVLRGASFEVPASGMANCELMVTAHGPDWPEVRLDGKPVKHVRSSWSTSWRGATGKWRTRCYDLLPYQGRRITAEVSSGGEGFGADIVCDLLMIQDQSVTEAPGSDDVRLPLPVSQRSRRAVAGIGERIPLVNGRYKATRAAPPEDNATRAVTADALPADHGKFHIFLLMGQSNMSGFAPLQPGDDRPVNGIFHVPTVSQNGFAWVPSAHPLHNRQPSNRFGLGLPFAIEYRRQHPGVTVGLIPLGWGGAELAAMVKGSAVYRDALAKAAFAQSRGVLKGVLWHQGESDTVTTAETDAYAAKLNALVQDLRRDLKTPELPFVAGDLAEFYGTSAEHNAPDRVARIRQVRQVLRTLPQHLPNTAFVESTGLRSEDAHNVHFDRASYIELGRRYAIALRSLER